MYVKISPLGEVGRENQAPGNRLASQRLNLSILSYCVGPGHGPERRNLACLRPWASSPSTKENLCPKGRGCFARAREKQQEHSRLRYSDVQERFRLQA